MKVINSYLLVALLVGAAVLTGCYNKPISTNSTTNNDIKVEKLFSYEGCDVYRFDDGNYRYYTKCKFESETVADYTRTCGKNCFYKVSENIKTNY